MRITCVGGGPAGLYLALLMKRHDPAHDVTVLERNRPDDTFGWGVVFSDQTLSALRAADPKTATEILDAFNHWDDIEIHFGGRTIRSSGHGFCGIGRQRLLHILQTRCAALGVRLCFETDVSDDASIGADLIVAADGLNSRLRARYSATFQPDIALGQCRFVWLGTHTLFEAFTFAFEKTEWGWFQAHAYRFDKDASTFIVETPDDVWKAAGLAEMSKEEGIRFCERLFERYLDGQPLMSNAAHLRGSSQWIRFPRVVCRTWIHESGGADGRTPVVLVGDAAHTAHFSIGSGTKLALEDAIDLASSLASQPDDVMGALKSVRSASKRRGAPPPERGAQFDRVVRKRRASRPARARTVRLFPADALAADLPRKPSAARRRISGRLRTMGRPRGGAVRRRIRPADVHAVPPARADAQESRGRLADGAVQRGRRHADRSPSRAPGRARARWRRPRVHGDDLPVTGRAHHAGVYGSLHRRAHRRLETDRRFRAHRHEREDCAAAGPRRTERLHPRAVGGRRSPPPGAGAELASRRRLAAAVPWTASAPGPGR